jgi:hypothetical protein
MPDALPVGILADPVVHVLLGHRHGERPAVVLLDDVQHHVEGRRAAGAGEALAVDPVELGAGLDLGKGLGEAVQAVPVDRAAIALEQAGPGQDEAAVRERSKRWASRPLQTIRFSGLSALSIEACATSSVPLDEATGLPSREMMRQS